MRKANRILALGLNPAYQKTILFDHLRFGAVNRSAESYAVASGKGINFARAVRTWGHAECVVLQPLGGVIGELVASGLAAEGIPAVTVPVKSCTRTCSTLLCGTAGTATEVIEPAASLSRQEYDRLFEALEKHLPDYQGLAICGTCPPGIPPEFYCDAARLARRQGIPVLLDAFRDMREVLSQGLAFLKINREELFELSGCQMPTSENMREFREAYGIVVLAVTDGAGDALLSSSDGTFRISVPKLESCRNPIGAGDTCGAVLFSGYLERKPLPEVFAQGLAAASASCMTLEPAFFDPAVARELYRSITMERI